MAAKPSLYVPKSGLVGLLRSRPGVAQHPAEDAEQQQILSLAERFPNVVQIGGIVGARQPHRRAQHRQVPRGLATGGSAIQELRLSW